MAANLLSVTVLEAGSQVPTQDGTQNIWLLNKNRILKFQASGTDTLMDYALRNDQQANIQQYLVDDTYATIKTGVITNAYTCAKKAEFTVISENGVDLAAPELRVLSVDQIVYVTDDLAAPGTNSILSYLDLKSMTPQPIKVLGDFAAVITATTS